MEVEKILKGYKESIRIVPREEKIAETVQKSGEMFCRKEQERMLSYAEFLKIQFFILRKRWWIFQCLLLTASGLGLGIFQEEYYIRRSVGIVSVLFVVLIIPEMWKNRTYNSMEVETASYYSLRQIYAARMLLFGAADFCMAALFCFSLHGRLHFTATELLTQFLFPMVVTACICFGILCNRYAVSEIAAIAACLVWSGVWWMFAMDERIYRAALLPVWIGLFFGLVFLTTAAVFGAVKNCGKCLENEFERVESKRLLKD